MKVFLTLLVTFSFLVFNAGFNVEARDKKSDKSTVSKELKKVKKSKNKSKKKKTRKYKRSSNAPDLRALTTESPTNKEYSESPHDGVNAIEVIPGL